MGGRLGRLAEAVDAGDLAAHGVPVEALHKGAAAVAAVAEDLAAASVLVKTALVATGCYFLILPLFREGGAIAKGNLDG